MTSARTRLSPAARRRQLIDLGVELARDRPLELVTMEAVAEAAGVSKGLIFHYFESKADFHLCVITEQAEEMLARTAPRDDIGDTIEMLQASITAYVDYVADNGRGFVGVIRGAASADAAIRAVADRTRAAMTERILSRAPSIGIERTPAIELAVAGWIAFVEESLVRWIDDPVVTRDQLVQIFVGALPTLAGLVGAVVATD
ncbi:TetR/AcrR family transcriptional regulator [Gordonia neofelifaecis]|uniref:Regulatory protein TetR n=1 Tax=Gordonia neofelifaecis NRRL B-59395 TaxID=644548 RepID=F1YFN0_9ACTN|nr:TetR/AcrR family transcriptional regulator [Gordonia neofelifaecis]EGD56662.1 regulatory protein TetR [Gordonia neofelifaecis NRRL B-59395]